MKSLSTEMVHNISLQQHFHSEAIDVRLKGLLVCQAILTYIYIYMYRVSIKSLYNLKKLLQSKMMRYRNEGCFMLISIS